jgi:hypothetical protein
MTAQFCSQCGTPAVAGDRYCRNCGDTLIEATVDLPRGFGPAAAGEVGTPQFGAGHQAGGQYYGRMAMTDEQPLAQFDVAYPERLSRGLIFIKWLLAIPHFVVLYIYNAVAGIVVFFAWFAILFTGRFPEAMFSFVEGYFRWQANAAAYLLLLRDEYPPFSNAPGRYPVQFAIGYPPRLSRGLIFIKWLLAIPSIIVLEFLAIAAMVTTLIAWFAILFTGRYPEGLFRFAVGVFRWSMRVNTYLYLMTDRYPPFTTAAAPA